MDRPTTAKNNRIAVGFAIFLMVLGLAMGVFGVWFMAEANRARSWPTTSGTIVSVTVRSSRGSSSSARRYHAEVLYRYSVDGSSFTSKRYQLGSGPNAGEFNHREEALDHSKQWVEGESIDVYYDPTEPDSAVLERNASWGVYVPGILGFFFFLGGVAIWVSLRKSGS